LADAVAKISTNSEREFLIQGGNQDIATPYRQARRRELEENKHDVAHRRGRASVQDEEEVIVAAKSKIQLLLHYFFHYSSFIIPSFHTIYK